MRESIKFQTDRTTDTLKHLNYKIIFNVQFMNRGGSFSDSHENTQHLIINRTCKSETKGRGGAGGDFKYLFFEFENNICSSELLLVWIT